MQRPFTFACACVAALIHAPEAIAGDNLMAYTPSGKPDMIFYDANPTAASDKLVTACMDGGMAVTDQSDRQVTCEVDLDDIQSIFSQFLLGNSYSTKPRQFLKFNLVDTSDGARVQATSWIETQMALGQLQRQPLASDNQQNRLMQFMLSAGTEWLPGTSFPNYAHLGIHWDDVVQLEVGKRKRAALVVAETFPDSSASEFGIRRGDQIVSINGKHFVRSPPYFSSEKERRKRRAPYFELLEGQLLRMLRGANDEGVIELSIVRDGQVMDFKGAVERRSSVLKRTETTLSSDN